jgi:hypothetical protein
MGFVSFNDEVEQYLCAAVLRPGNVTAAQGAVGLVRRLIPRSYTLAQVGSCTRVSVMTVEHASHASGQRSFSILAAANVIASQLLLQTMKSKPHELSS